MSEENVEPARDALTRWQAGDPDWRIYPDWDSALEAAGLRE